MKLRTIAWAAMLGCVQCHAAITNLFSLGFDNPAEPWANSGTVSFTNTVGSPADGVLDGSSYAYGTDFEGTLSGNYGVQLWIKNPGLVGEGEDVVVISIGNPDTDGISLRYNPAEGGYFSAVGNGMGGGGVFSAEHSLSEWTHVGLVYAGSFFIYIDGVLAGTVSAPVIDPTSEWYLFTSGATATKLSGTVAGINAFVFEQDGFVAEEDLAIFAIPEPASWAGLAGFAVLGVAVWRRRR